MKKILVTGADGFIGSHLVEYLIEKGHEVKAFCCYNSFGHAGWLSSISEKKRTQIEFIYGDIRDSDSVLEAVKGSHTVFHLASLIAIPFSYRAPRAYIDTNINGTVNVLMGARRHDARVVHTSTSEVYGTAAYVPIDEGHPLRAQSPYAASKIAADQMALSFYCSFGLPVSIVRPFNTFGPRQSARAIIPTIINQLRQGTTELSLGMIQSTRDFTFVDDTVKGIASFLEASGTEGEVINLGTGYEISIENLALEIASILGKEITFKVDDTRLRPTKSEVMRLCSSNEKAKSLLNWSPLSSNKEGLRNGLIKTVDWFETSGNKFTINCDSKEFVY